MGKGRKEGGQEEEVSGRIGGRERETGETKGKEAKGEE